MSFTIKFLIDRTVRLTEPGMTFEKWRNAAPDVEQIIGERLPDSRVAVFALPEGDDNVIHILGRWH